MLAMPMPAFWQKIGSSCVDVDLEALEKQDPKMRPG
jgi:hypothetical protein